MAPAANNSVFLVDSHSLIFQVFHAIRGMTSPSGLPTNALFGFVRDLLFLREQQPAYLICAFDRAEPTFRSEIYPEYKAHRDPVPEDLIMQIPLIEQALAAMNIPVLSHPRYEADDILATLAAAASREGKEAWIYTSDKDCRQLISDRIRLFNLRKRTEFGRKDLMEDWGVTPEQVVDLQALVGDSVDNVPGVPGIGVKTAAKLLQDFGTLENVLANVDKIAGAKRQENLRAAGPIVALSRQLVRLATDVPIPLEWGAWKLRPMDTPKLVELFREWGFHSFGNQVRQMAKAESPPEPSVKAAGSVQGELFPFGANDENETATEPIAPGQEVAKASNVYVGHDGWKTTYHLVDTPEKFDMFLQELRKQKRFVCDLETTSLQALEAEIVGLAFAWKTGEGWYLALRGPAGSALLDSPKTLAKLKPIFEDSAQAKANQNIKYDYLVLRGKGICARGVTGDPMVADYLLHAGERSHNLEELARRYLNYQVIPITDLIGKKSRKQPQQLMDQVATERVATYACEDADVAWRLCEILEKDLTDAEKVSTSGSGATSSLRKLYDDLEVPLIEVLAELEFNGIRLDLPLLARLGEGMAKQLATIEGEIHALAGHSFNIGSLPQLRKVLFDELKLPAQRKTGITGASSTDQETLEKLAALDHPGAALPRKILEHRQISKLKGTYVDALPTLVSPKTGRVHASFNQTVAATGRLSSSDPNLQNIPVRREQGQQIRQAFIPAEGWTLITADYSQIELRLLAHFCGDEALRRAFAEDRDVHSAVAAQIYGVDEKLVNAEMRRAAKTVNFGVIYGISAHGLAQRLEISRDEAGRFITAYFARYPRVEEYQQQLLRDCQRTGYVTTILGRRRRIEGVREHSTYQQRNQPEREAINMQVQGSAADLIKLAMLNLHRRLRRENRMAQMLLQIHDELVFEAPPEEVKPVAALVREEMEKALPLEVPLKVDLGAGSNWLDVTDL